MGNQWAGGQGSEDDSGYRENDQGSEEHSEEHSEENDKAERRTVMEMMRFIREELGDSVRLAWGRMICRFLERHNSTCEVEGNDRCARKNFEDDGEGDMRDDAR